jgi:hypothetical protein
MSASEKQKIHLAKLHKKQVGSKRSEASRKLMAEKARINAQINFEGGSVANAFADTEYYLYYGDPVVPFADGKLRRHFFRLDFAHIEAQCNIELDGPGHKSTPAQDAVRDKILRELGWKVIRIKHGKEKL